MSISTADMRALPSVRARYAPLGTGLWMIASTAVAFIGTQVLLLGSRSGSPWDAFTDQWLIGTSWLLLLAVSIAGAFWAGRLLGAAAAVLASSFVFGEVIVAATSLAPLIRGPFDRASTAPPLEAWGDSANDIVGLLLILGGGISILWWTVRFVSREVRLTGRVERSAYRIEVLMILAVLFIATALSAAGGSLGGITVLVTVLPNVIVLALLLRAPGDLSLGVVVGMALSAVLMAFLAAWQSDIQVRPGFLNLSSSVPATLLSAGVALLLILVVILWNLAAPSVPPSASATGLDSWATVAFVLAFVPLLSIPAVIIGHLSYERLRTSGLVGSGRLLAGSAIVIGLANVFALLLLWVGASIVSSTILSDLGGWQA